MVVGGKGDLVGGAINIETVWDSVVRPKSVSENLFLNGEGDGGGASPSLLFYPKNKTTKLAWQFTYSDMNG